MRIKNIVLKILSKHFFSKWIYLQQLLMLYRNLYMFNHLKNYQHWINFIKIYFDNSFLKKILYFYYKKINIYYFQFYQLLKLVNIIIKILKILRKSAFSLKESC
jgi:hypothetical protein